MKAFDRIFALSICLSFLAYFGLTVFRQIWLWDFGLHLSAVAALQQSFLNPGHEAIAWASTQETQVYSPYIFCTALLGKLLSLSPFATMQLIGLLNLLAYVFAIFHFFRTFGVNRECWTAPALFLLASLTVRESNYVWSSETSLLTFKWILTYPSTFAWTVSMLTLSEAELYLRKDRTRYLATASFGTWFLVSSHMLTASWVIGLIILRLLFPRVVPLPASRRQSWSLLAGITLSTVATFLWPHQDPLKMLSIAGAPENPPFGQNLFNETWYTFLLGVPALLYFARRKQHQLWLLWFAGSWFALIVCKLLGMSFGSRFLFFQQFFVHAAIAEVVALVFKQALRGKRREFDRPLLVISSLCIFGIALSPQFRGAVSGRDQLATPIELFNAPANRKVFFDKWGVFSPYIGPDDIVLTPGDESANYLAVYVGSRSVLSLFPFFVKDVKERQEATSTFLDPAQSWDTRKEVLKKYKVTKVLIPCQRVDLVEQLRNVLGKPIFQSDDYFVFAVGQ